MIATLRGTLTAKAPTEIVLDVGGVGYGLSIPLSTFEKLDREGAVVTLCTYLHVREDALHLYGFLTEEERTLFRLLLSVTGIGPRVALGILSSIPSGDLRTHLAAGNTGALTAIPGIGRKLAERLVVELRDKISKAEFRDGTALIPGDPRSRARSEALLALTSLGYSRPVAERAVRAAADELGEQAAHVEELLKAALRHATP